MRRLAPILVVSALVRLGLLAAMVVHDVSPLYDESGYLRAARLWTAFASAPFSDGGLDRATLRRAVAPGDWPPLWPILVALAGGTAAGGRGLGVALSVGTTALVFRLGRRVASERAAAAGAWLHALSPTFAFYAVSLWSETAFLAFALAGLDRALAFDRSARRGSMRAALATGCLLGAAALVRTVGLLWILVVLGWWCRDPRRAVRRWAPISACAGLLVLLLVSWQAVLQAATATAMFQNRASGWNLALGNHPDVPPGLGSSWGHEPSKALLVARLEARAAPEGREWRDVAGTVALEEIRRRPGAALERALRRAGELAGPDLFPARHLTRVVTPPIPGGVLALALATIWIVGLFLRTAAVCGVLERGDDGDPDGRRLLMIVGAASLVPPLATIATSRFVLSSLAPLLPLAGRALARLRPAVARRTVVVSVAVTVLAVLQLPNLIRIHLQPSARVGPVLAPLAAGLGVEARTADRIELRHVRRAGARNVRVETQPPGFGVVLPGPTRPARSARAFDVVAPLVARPLELRLSSGARSVVLHPTSPENWRRWRSTGLPGLEIRWRGASPARAVPAALEPGPPTSRAQVSTISKMSGWSAVSPCTSTATPSLCSSSRRTEASSRCSALATSGCTRSTTSDLRQ